MVRFTSTEDMKYLVWRLFKEKTISCHGYFTTAVHFGIQMHFMIKALLPSYVIQVSLNPILITKDMLDVNALLITCSKCTLNGDYD